MNQKISLFERISMNGHPLAGYDFDETRMTDNITGA